MRIAKSVFALAAAMTAPGAVAQYGEPMYAYSWYSDASYTTETGHASPQCSNRGITYLVYGTRTTYEQQELVAYCNHGRVEPA